MISVVCAVKNRLSTLRVSLASWLVAKGVDEVVIVDWSSDEPVAPFVTSDERVKVVRVEGQRYFHLSAALNLAEDHSTGEAILKMDADYVINPFYNLLSVLNLGDKSFVTGSAKLGGPFFGYLNGFVYLRKKDWNRVKGYNENLEDYGWDDDDFYARLEDAGLERKILSPPPIFVFHIPHNDLFRTIEYENKDFKETHSRNKRASIEFPYLSRRYRWNSRRTGGQTFVAEIAYKKTHDYPSNKESA